LTYRVACNRFSDTMLKGQPISKKTVLRGAIAVCLAISMLLVSSAPSTAQGAKSCCSESEAEANAGAHERVAHTCCCSHDGPSCDCDLQAENKSPPSDLAPSSTQIEQRPVLSDDGVAHSGSLPGHQSGKMPCASFVFARAPAFIYLLNLTLIC
jgi:hypothetical protein